jgi:phosphate-selective porin OprO/OprP
MTRRVVVADPGARSKHPRGIRTQVLAVLTVIALAGFGLLISPRAAGAQATDPPAATATIDSTLEAGEADAETPSRRMVKWNEYDGPISTARFGYGFVYDFATYSQDDASKQQVSMPADHGLRDFRVLFKGRFKTQRGLSWTMGVMYDGTDEDWHFRQTGFQVDVPEVSGRFFIGRTKEGYSQAKVMVGYYLFGIERSQTLDAFIPILADGIKYMGYFPRQRVFVNLGYFFDGFSEKEKFAIYDDQLVTRVGWQPILSEAERKVLHVAVMSRRATPDEGKIRFKSKPGSWLAPNFLDTGTLTSDQANTFGLEANYRSGSWLFASEYDWQTAELAGGGKPMFHGGDISATWLITGETRPYNKTGGFYAQVTPKRSVFEGGRGAVEANLTFTYNDFDEGSIDGGKFWRITPMARWYLSEYIRFEGAYGYGELDRFGLKGRTQFFQARVVSIL